MPSHTATRPLPFFLLAVFGFCLLTMGITSVYVMLPDEAKPTKQTAATAPAQKDAAAPVSAEGDAPNADTLSEQQTGAISTFMQKLQQNPNDADALREIGKTFLEAKEWERAEVFLQRSIVSRPADINTRYLLAKCLYGQNKMAEAAACFEEILSMQEDAPALYNLAVINKYHLSQPEKAKELFTKLLALPKLDSNTREAATKELQE
ncbi:tetratricopeptide repeat protein [Desulfovibrio sp. OttesenSCG-928-G15]|nr:tetratricopeptide repeat protein [Desulfovibrio sp. OttesenSCG-928-G15]